MVLFSYFRAQWLYEIWVFPSTELRAKGYAMPSPKSVLVSGAQTGVTEVDIVIPWFDPELSLNSFLGENIGFGWIAYSV